MLKIRDDADLKELEKFGFEYEEEDGEKYWCKYLSDNQHKLFIYEDAKENQNQGYTVDDVCGLTSDCWEENVITDTNEKPTLLEELNESIINNLKSLVKEEQEKNDEEEL